MHYLVMRIDMKWAAPKYLFCARLCKYPKLSYFECSDDYQIVGACRTTTPVAWRRAKQWPFLADQPEEAGEVTRLIKAGDQIFFNRACPPIWAVITSPCGGTLCRFATDFVSPAAASRVARVHRCTYLPHTLLARRRKACIRLPNSRCPS